MQIRITDLSQPKTQFIWGLALHLSFLFVLYSFEVSFANLQAPIGAYQNNIWSCGDVMTYINPAFNYLEFGVFGINDTPDHFRTIGYPALISFFYSMFGKSGFLLLQIFQCVIFAFIYPLITQTAKILLQDDSKKLLSSIFIALCISGTYFSRSAVILTDTFFTLLFVAGFYFGMRSYITRIPGELVFYLFFMTIAALIRPTLTLLPILNLMMGYWVAKKYRYPIRPVMFRSLLISVGIFFLINISTVRNYVNHSFLSPSSVIGTNAFEYLAKKVLLKEGRTDSYSAYKEELLSINDISIKTKKQKAIMYETILHYPVSTLRVLWANSINLFLSNNLVSNIANYFGYEWKQFKNPCYPLQISNVLAAINYFLMLLYALLWLLFVMKLLSLWQERDYETLGLIALLVVMFIIPALLTGDGGSRFRLPFEHILFIFGISRALQLSSTLKMYIYRKKP